MDQAPTPASKAQQAANAATRQERSDRAARGIIVGIFVNGALALAKGVTGYLGHSQVLIADAIESSTDVVGSLIVLFGLRIAASPASARHPFGKGKVETLSAAAVAGALLLAAAWITVTSIHEIMVPHRLPAPFTLGVLVAVIIIKETLFRTVLAVGTSVESLAVQSDAWHHRSDAITSAAAFIGIAVALLGGPGFESADDWAALVAAAIITANGVNILIPALRELTDAAPRSAISDQIRAIAATVPGVTGTHRCWVRKHGFDHFVDLDVLVDGSLTVKQGHDIAHAVHDAVVAELPFVRRVLVHVEPYDEFGRFKLEWERDYNKNM